MQQTKIEFEKVENIETILKSSHYRVVDLEKEYMYFNALMQQLPELYADKLISGAYRIKFPAGLQGELMQLKQGGFSTTVLKNGKITGTASLIPIGAETIALTAFSVLAVITGQFYLFRINKQLEDINKKLQNVLDFLYNEKLCELEAEFEFVRFAYENYRYIAESETEKQATLGSIQESRKKAYKDILFYALELRAVISNELKKKRTEVDEQIDDYLKKRFSYQYSLELYCISMILELLYAQNYDVFLIKNIHKKLDKVLEDGKALLNKTNGAVAGKLSDSKVFKDNIEKNKLYKEVDEFEFDGNQYLDMMECLKKFSKPLEIVWYKGQLLLKEEAL